MRIPKNCLIGRHSSEFQRKKKQYIKNKNLGEETNTNDKQQTQRPENIIIMNMMWDKLTSKNCLALQWRNR